MSRFLDSLKRNINNLLADVDRKCYNISYVLFMAVIKATPHDTKWSRGNLINDWHTASNSYSFARFSPVDSSGNGQISANTDTTGSGSVSRVGDFKTVQTFRGKDGFLSMSNSQPYAYRAEYLGWPKDASVGGWEWTGNVTAYAMVRNSLTTVAALYR